MFCVYYWGALGQQSGHIRCDRHRFRAVLVRGYKYRRSDKFLSDVTRRAGVAVVARSVSPVDLSTQEGAQATEPDFPTVPGWEDDASLCLITYQEAKSATGPKLPADQQRLVGFEDMQGEEFKEWVREKRERQQVAA